MKTCLPCVALVLLILASGCEPATPPETYKGKPLEEWMKLADDRDTVTRAGAIEALGNMKADAAQARVRQAALSDAHDKVRVRALRFCASTMPESDLLKVLGELARHDADAGIADNVLTDPFIDAVERLEGKAAPLLPDLKAIAAKDKSEVHASMVKDLIFYASKQPPK